ncbi:MAG: hypothetical protein ABSF91_08300 [Bacteroidota bacterium]|jgi:hypothetical protein
MTEKSEILVLVSTSDPDMAKGSKGLIDKVPAPVKLDAELLKNNLTAFLQAINQLLSGVPKVMEPFKLDEIELAIEVNGEGNIQLVGGVKVGAKGGITLKLKR